jgi:SAM-dependent methyltransferase
MAEAIPLSSGSVDMIFMSMSFHHFSEPDLATLQCRRVLRPNGQVFVRTGTREQIDAYPYVPFFPSSRSILQEVLPDRGELREVFEAAGFHMLASQVVTQTIAPDWTSYAAKLAAGGDSVLARLSRPEIDDGLAALRTRATQEADCAVVEPIDLLVFR